MTSTLTMKVPVEMAQKLEAVAARQRVPKSKLMREALFQFLNQQQEEPSLYDLMKDGIGCFDSGKTDMATNPKYMKGFGKWRS